MRTLALRLARTALATPLAPRSILPHARPVLTPLAFTRARSQAAIDEAAPPPPGPEPTEEQLSADLMDEVELDEAEWEGEEVQEGVYMSLPTPPAAQSSSSGAASRPKKTHSIKHLNRLLSRHSVPDIPEDELEERFVRGRGPGGQAINKTNSSVSLIHLPTGIRVQAQPTRSRPQNRIIARQILKERLDLMRVRGELDGVDSAYGVDIGKKAKGQSGSAGEAEGEADKKVSRKERLAAEARTWSKAELRWEKERRRKANRVKKVKRRAKGEDGEAEDGGEGKE